jgi:spermidine/putrescine-binding protein
MERVMRFRRRTWLNIFYFIFVTAFLAISAERTCAQSADLIQAAKKEGEVVVFGTLENDVAGAVHKGFEAKYGIKTNYFRASSTVIIDRVTSEQLSQCGYRVRLQQKHDQTRGRAKIL